MQLPVGKTLLHCTIVSGKRPQSADLIIVELVVYRANHKLRARLGTALDQRGDERLLSRFAEIWGSDNDKS